MILLIIAFAFTLLALVGAYWPKGKFERSVDRATKR